MTVTGGCSARNVPNSGTVIWKSPRSSRRKDSTSSSENDVLDDLPARLSSGLDLEELTWIVPLAHGVGDVQSLLALEPDERRFQDPREDPSHFGLAHAGLALQKERPLPSEGQKEAGGQPGIREVVDFGQGGAGLVDGVEPHGYLSSAGEASRASGVSMSLRTPSPETLTSQTSSLCSARRWRAPTSPCRVWSSAK